MAVRRLRWRNWKKPAQILLAGVLVLGGLAVSSQKHASAAPSGSGWEQTFSDDFDSLDSTKWKTAWSYWWDGSIREDNRTRQLAYYPDENVSIVTDTSAGGNGKVVRLRTAKEDTYVSWENKTYNYTAGVLQSSTRFKQTYGYYEARIKTFNSSAKGYITDFWLAPFANKWPPELDVMETAGSDSATKAHFFEHYSDSNGAHQYQGIEKALDPSQWHTYGVQWEPGKLTWFVDGTQVGSSITTGVPSEDMFLILSTEVGNDGYWGNPDAGTWPQYMEVDYVKVWKKSGITSGQTYEISSKVDGNKAFDVDSISTADGAAVQVWDYVGGGNQKWKAEDVGGGFYKLTATHSNKVLDICNNSTGQSCLKQSTYTGADSQLWKIEDQGNGYYRIVSKLSGLVIDLPNSNTTNGTDLQTYWWNGSDAQLWKLTSQ
ncbi:beta-glucanase (GH16 family) [Paenibacillus rhizosphaerae]|uniref:Beta-glucanase (GH16 family) n=1 Tax=Paenibacillus rhizosphaerae TaxID=297318 RepID=A0A839TK81_9BACL|nr:RICIN domain-containing protein [Paenibacillus rhizosphaerae]MBB3127052.1 beta-glucanase (GH16 family) [Paenibacillus rhizosphaerae]